MSRSWSLVSALLIFFPFTAVSLTYTYDSDAILHVCVGDDEELPLVVLTEQEETLLLGRVVGVRNGDGERIHESGERFSERNTMFLAVRFILGRVPFKRRPHAPSLHHESPRWRTGVVPPHRRPVKPAVRCSGVVRLVSHLLLLRSLP